MSAYEKIAITMLWATDPIRFDRVLGITGYWRPRVIAGGKK